MVWGRVFQGTFISFSRRSVPRMVLCQVRPDGSKEDADMPSSSSEGAPVYQATVTEGPLPIYRVGWVSGGRPGLGVAC